MGSTLLNITSPPSEAEGARLSTSKTQPDTLQNEFKFKKLGLKVVAGLGGELANVKKAAAMDSKVLSS